MSDTPKENTQEWENPNFPMRVTEEEDGVLVIEWDETHPATSLFNGWTEEDFTTMLMDACERMLAKYGEEIDV